MTTTQLNTDLSEFYLDMCKKFTISLLVMPGHAVWQARNYHIQHLPKKQNCISHQQTTK